MVTASTSIKIRQKIEETLGKRLRKKRLEYGMSQKTLGNAIGVSFQQIQKYESGTDRIAVSTLLAMAKALNFTVGAFCKPLLVSRPPPVRPMPDLAEIKTAQLIASLPAAERRAMMACVRYLAKSKPA